MIPCDWIGIVTIRSDTRCSTSTIGMINRSPGPRAPTTRPNRKSTPRSYCFTIRTASPRTTATTMTTMTMTTAVTWCS